jgi:hypothetical protein
MQTQTQTRESTAKLYEGLMLTCDIVEIISRVFVAHRNRSA